MLPIMKFARHVSMVRVATRWPFWRKLDHTLFVRSEREEPGQRNGIEAWHRSAGVVHKRDNEGNVNLAEGSQ